MYSTLKLNLKLLESFTGDFKLNYDLLRNIVKRQNKKMFSEIGSQFNKASKIKEKENKLLINKLNKDQTNEIENLLKRSKEIYNPKNPVLINENEEILLYFNKISISQLFTLSLRYTLPITALFILIKTNPFYLTFPVMLPIMTFTLAYYFLAFFNFLRSLQNVVEEMWLDKSGNEIKIVFRNKTYRKFRGVPFEEKLINQAMVTPSGINKKVESKISINKNLIRIENLFPENQNFESEDLISYRYFWRKYYLTKRTFLLIGRR